MSERASFESAFKVPLYLRRARAGSITFSFFNSSDSSDFNDYSDGRVLQFLIRRYPTSTALVTLASGSGLSASGNDITISITEVQSALSLGLYWWELYDSTNKKTLGIARLEIGSREPVEADDSVTVYSSNTTISVSITHGGTVDHWRGSWDGSGNLFPTTGGSGGNGAIQVGDEFLLSQAATLASYGQSAVEWPAGSIAKYLGSNNWRLY